MELAQRLTGPEGRPTNGRHDPFAEVKDRIHKAVISGLGPRLFNTETDPATLRDRVRGGRRRGARGTSQGSPAATGSGWCAS